MTTKQPKRGFPSNIGLASLNVRRVASPTFNPTACTAPRHTGVARNCVQKSNVKNGTIMEGSKLRYQTWVIALYLLTAGIKGVSSMKLQRDLGVTPKKLRGI